MHDDDIIDVLEPGEAFGHPSLLTGLAPAFDVRAREETTCLVLPADHASELLAGPAGVRFVARSLRDRMVRTGYVAHAGGDVRNAKLGSLVHRPAASARPRPRSPTPRGRWPMPMFRASSSGSATSSVS